jgi:hypothetical protein
MDTDTDTDRDMEMDKDTDKELDTFARYLWRYRDFSAEWPSYCLAHFSPNFEKLVLSTPARNYSGDRPLGNIMLSRNQA